MNHKATALFLGRGEAANREIAELSQVCLNILIVLRVSAPRGEAAAAAAEEVVEAEAEAAAEGEETEGEGMEEGAREGAREEGPRQEETREGVVKEWAREKWIDQPKGKTLSQTGEKGAP